MQYHAAKDNETACYALAQIPVMHQGDRKRVRADPSPAICHLSGTHLRRNGGTEMPENVS